MAKQLLGKEVTAALNERIKANVAELQGKGVNPTRASSALAKTQVISLMKEEQQNVAKHWVLHVKKSFFREM